MEIIIQLTHIIPVLIGVIGTVAFGLFYYRTYIKHDKDLQQTNQAIEEWSRKWLDKILSGGGLNDNDKKE